MGMFTQWLCVLLLAASAYGHAPQVIDLGTRFVPEYQNQYSALIARYLSTRGIRVFPIQSVGALSQTIYDRRLIGGGRGVDFRSVAGLDGLDSTFTRSSLVSGGGPEVTYESIYGGVDTSGLTDAAISTVGIAGGVGSPYDEFGPGAGAGPRPYLNGPRLTGSVGIGTGGVRVDGPLTGGSSSYFSSSYQSDAPTYADLYRRSRFTSSGPGAIGVGDLGVGDGFTTATTARTFVDTNPYDEIGEHGSYGRAEYDGSVIGGLGLTSRRTFVDTNTYDGFDTNSLDGLGEFGGLDRFEVRSGAGSGARTYFDTNPYDAIDTRSELVGGDFGGVAAGYADVVGGVGGVDGGFTSQSSYQPGYTSFVRRSRYFPRRRFTTRVVNYPAQITRFQRNYL